MYPYATLCSPSLTHLCVLHASRPARNLDVFSFCFRSHKAKQNKICTVLVGLTLHAVSLSWGAFKVELSMHLCLNLVGDQLEFKFHKLIKFILSISGKLKVD